MRRRNGCDYVVASVLPFKRHEASDRVDEVHNYTHADARADSFVGRPLIMNHQNGTAKADGTLKPLRRIGTVLASAEHGTDTLMLAELDNATPQSRHSSTLVAMGRYGDVSLGNAWWECADGSLGKRSVEVSLVERGRRPGSHTLAYLPSRATLERLARDDRATLDDAAARFGFERPPPTIDDEYIARVERAIDQRFGELVARHRFAPMSEASDDQPMAEQASAPQADATKDEPMAVDEQQPLSVKNPEHAAKMALNAAREAAELRRRLAEMEASRAEMEAKAKAYDDEQKKRHERYRRELESALASFKDLAKRSKTVTPERAAATERWALEHFDKYPDVSIDHVKGAIELMSEASEANEARERAEIEAKRAKRSVGLVEKLEDVDRQIAAFNGAYKQPVPPPHVEPLASMNFAEPAAAAAPPPRQQQQPMSCDDEARREYTKDSAVSFLACSEDDPDTPDIASEYALMKRLLGREPSYAELARGVRRASGFDENSLTGERTERTGFERARAQPFTFGAREYAPAFFSRLMNDFASVTAPTAPRQMMTQAQAPSIKEQ